MDWDDCYPTPSSGRGPTALCLHEMEWSFPRTLTEGRLVRRYKRFLADVELPSGEVVVAHCVNTGRMLGCSDPGSMVWLEPAPPQSKRKLQWTWVLTKTPSDIMVGVHTGYPNRFVAEALRQGSLASLKGYAHVRTEVRMGASSRVDVLLTDHETCPQCWVEVKNVTLARDGVAFFPDAVTERGRKHLDELSARVAEGDRAAMVFVVQRSDVHSFRPADDIDARYGETLRSAVETGGVEAYALRVEPSPSGLRLLDQIPVMLSE
jgi:sugar fermentation stimulation protein A